MGHPAVLGRSYCAWWRGLVALGPLDDDRLGGCKGACHHGIDVPSRPQACNLLDRRRLTAPGAARSLQSIARAPRTIRSACC